jgi:hypothetical protein
MKRLAVILVAAAAAGAAGVCSALPPRARPLRPAPLLAAAIRGAFHVHTRRSDGTGTVDEVAAAARRADLQFVIFTDHGDGTAKPQDPVYRHGVLCIDAVEISTNGGHAIALGMSRAPYPLAGEPRDVVEDIARLGGMSIAAHPGSGKPELQWIDWTAPVDGLEWLNLDSEWRDETRGTLARALLTYPFRRRESLAALLDRPGPVIARWDALAARRPVVALAAGDAHARLGLRDGGGEPYAGPAGLLRLPAYEQVFRAMSISLPGVSLTGDPLDDASAVIGAIRRGAAYSSVEALAEPAAFEFAASSDSGQIAMGAAAVPSGPVSFHARTNAPDARITLLRDGEPIATANGGSLERTESPAEGVYRVEVHLPGAPGDPPIAWIVSNPIYLRSAGPAAGSPAQGALTEFSELYGDGPAQGWAVEHSPRSKAAVDVVASPGGTQLLLRYALGGPRSESPYAAFVAPAGPALSGFDGLVFTARASRPMRLSVQLRAAGGAGERWRRSVHVDETQREITVAFDEMTPVGGTSRRRPDRSAADAILFVVDTTNTPPGASGEIYIDDVRYAR